ncbi:hypothetical protein [Sphingobium sp. CAP-1]|uniref:hypothetical protein n=1 Tax=Sphingobium sp. CAP-1 TaxID=2676077 RepID=UPI0012BB3F5C|nr:hypothetical protein [Sphingobium sp. CAP-1]QGP80031.1 hypothetical protein GL174_14320 [Sphingobium sp. CAP-1]
MFACNFPGSRPIGAPREWNAELDGEVGTIFVMDITDVLSGHNIMASFYQPSPADLAALNAGGAIRLGIMGQRHPVFQLGVVTPAACAEAQLRPAWDMGEPI